MYDDMAGNWRLYGITDALLLVNRLRRRHFSRVGGRVLDVACGTGENFPHLRAARRVTAFDLAPRMVAEARLRARQMEFEVALLAADAESMPFPDDCFDHVISAFGSCTFPDHVTAFREMVRVTRPGGEVLLLEHGRSSVTWIARRQDRNVQRVIERSACRNNRNVLSELADAGITPSRIETSHLGMMTRLTIAVG